MTAYFRIAAVVACLGLAGGLYLKGRSDGVAAEAARQVLATKQVEADLAAVAVEVDRLETERLAVEAASQELQRKLQSDADKDTNAANIAIGIASVRRLNQAR